jgi:hypothetical protein
MATKTAANGAVTATSTKNNGGVGMNIGNGSSLLTKEESVSDGYGVFASTPLDDSSADKALTAGTFKYENQRGVMQRATSSLAGVSKDFLTHAADDTDNADSIHSIGSITTVRLATAIRAGYWNPTTGAFSSGPTAATDNFYDIADGDTSDAADDNAASASRTRPGEFTYKLGQQLPVSADYPAKTS